MKESIIIVILCKVMAKKVVKSKKKKLVSDRDKLFVMEMLSDPKLNPEKAAKKVGYADSVARSKAYLWVSNSKQNPKPHVKELYDKILQQRNEKLDVSIQKIENELIKIAFSDLTDIIKAMGNQIDLTRLNELSNFQKAGILEVAEIIQDGFESRKIKMHSKLKALELLGKRFRMWTDETEPIKYLVEIIWRYAKNAE